MANFVPDDCADRSIIYGIRRIFIEERRLQYRCWKVERVLQWQIHRVHRLRSHGPLVSVNVLTYPRDLLAIMKCFLAPQVSKNIIGFDFQTGIIVPGFRVANPDIEAVELRLSLGLSGRSHPGERVNALVE